MSTKPTPEPVNPPDYVIRRSDGEITVEIPYGDGSVCWEFCLDEINPAIAALCDVRTILIAAEEMEHGGA